MDNAERAASVALDAFADTLRKTFGPASGAWFVQHPLQPSSPGYVSRQRPELFTFADQHVLPPPAPGAPEGLRFFEAPEADVEFALPGGDGRDDDGGAGAGVGQPVPRAHGRARARPPTWKTPRSPTTSRWSWTASPSTASRATCWTASSRGATRKPSPTASSARASFPPGDLAHVYVGRAMRAVGDVAERVRCHGETAPLALHVDGGPWRVDGSVAYCASGGALRQRPGRLRGTDLLLAWTDHLALCADETVDGIRRTVVHATDGSAVFGAIPPEEARALLQFLVRGALAFRHVPPPLFARASYEHARARRGSWLFEQRQRVVAAEARGWVPLRIGRTVAPDGPERFAHLSNDVHKAFGGQYESFTDLDDPAVALCYRRRAPLETMTASFDRWARLLWGPVLSALEDE